MGVMFATSAFHSRCGCKKSWKHGALLTRQWLSLFLIFQTTPNLHPPRERVVDATRVLFQNVRRIVERLVAELGPEVPGRVTGSSPAYQCKTPPPVETLQRAWQIGRDARLRFVYVDNLPFHRYNNTYCPTCGALLIRRFGFEVAGTMLRDEC
jgi:hypothetical protein